MKRSVIIYMALSVILFSTLVSALTSYDLNSAGSQVIDWIKGIFGPFFEVLLGTSVQEYFFEKVLFLILIYVIVLAVLKRIDMFKRNYFLCVLVSAIVSLLSARYITELQFVQLILLPYGALGTALLIYLPFLIYFFFVHNTISSGTGRRFAWIIYAAVFIGLWWKNSDKIGDLNWIYWIGLGLIALSFIFSDAIKRYFDLHELGKWSEGVKDINIARLQKDYQDLMNVDTPHAARAREKIAKRLKDLNASLPGSVSFS